MAFPVLGDRGLEFACMVPWREAFETLPVLGPEPVSEQVLWTRSAASLTMLRADSLSEWLVERRIESKAPSPKQAPGLRQAMSQMPHVRAPCRQTLDPCLQVWGMPFMPLQTMHRQRKRPPPPKQAASTSGSLQPVNTAGPSAAPLISRSFSPLTFQTAPE